MNLPAVYIIALLATFVLTMLMRAAGIPDPFDLIERPVGDPEPEDDAPDLERLSGGERL